MALQPTAPGSAPRASSPPPVAVAPAGADPPDKQVQDIGYTGDVSFQAAVFRLAGGGTTHQPGYPRGPAGPNSKLQAGFHPLSSVWARHHAEPGSPSGPPV
ncbi:hypothetical protein ACRRTK_014221 [Alexandromys fortis]